MRDWNPEYEGKLGELPRILKPLEPFKDDMLAARQPDPQHRARAARWRRAITAAAAGRTSPASRSRRALVDIKAGVSMDQIVANQIGSKTRFPSLEVGLEDARQSGDCDSGYSCAYTNNLAWRSETQPLPPILDPRALFERLFGNGVALTPEAARAQAEVPPQHPRFRHRRHQEAGDRPRPHGPAQAGRVPLVHPRGRAAARARRRRTTRRSIRTWTSRTASRPISPSTSS